MIIFSTTTIITPIQRNAGLKKIQIERSICYANLEINYFILTWDQFWREDHSYMQFELIVIVAKMMMKKPRKIYSIFQKLWILYYCKQNLSKFRSLKRRMRWGLVREPLWLVFYGRFTLLFTYLPDFGNPLNVIIQLTFPLFVRKILKLFEENINIILLVKAYHGMLPYSGISPEHHPQKF